MGLSFGGIRKKLDETWSGADFWDKKENAVQRQQFAQRQQPVVQQPSSRNYQGFQQQIKTGVAPSYGTGLTGLSNRFRDIADANTAQDRFKRDLASFKTPTPLKPAPLNEVYADQQKRMGNARPLDNIGQQFLGNTARLTNTAVSGASAVKELPGLARESIYGTDKSYQTSLNKINRNLDKSERTDSGIMRAGTVFDKPGQSKDISFKDVVKKSAGTGAGVYGEISPVAAGKVYKGTNLGLKVLARTGVGGSEAAFGSVGSQLAMNGKVDAKQTAMDTLFGIGLANTAPAVSNITKKGVQFLPSVAKKGVQVVKAVDNKLLDNPKIRGIEDTINTKKLLFDNASPSQRNILNREIAQLRQEVNSIKSGGGGRAIANDKLDNLADKISNRGKDPLESLKQEAKPPANAFQDTLPSKSRPASIRELVKRGGNPLYHDTNASGVLGILDSGEIRANQAPFSSIAGQGKRVSTTRNFDNYSRYGKSPYRFVIDETKTGQKAIPDNREEFESIFKNNVKTDSVETLAIDITNPEIINDMNNGRLAEVIAKAKEKGIRVETFEGKILPDEYANKEIQQLTKDRFTKEFSEATQSQPPKSPPIAKTLNDYNGNPIKKGDTVEVETMMGTKTAKVVGVTDGRYPEVKYKLTEDLTIGMRDPIKAGTTLKTRPEMVNQSTPKTVEAKPKVTAFDKEYRAKLDQRPANLRKIEQTTTNMSNAERLKLAKGDVGQAGIGSDPTALAEAKASEKPKATAKQTSEQIADALGVPKDQRVPTADGKPTLTKQEIAAIRPEPTRAKGEASKKVVIPKRNTDQAIRELAANLGYEIGEANTKLGSLNQGISAVTGGKYTTTRGLNPFRAGADAAGEALGRKGEAALTGKGSKALRVAEGGFAGTGRTSATKQIPRRFEGQLSNISDLMGRAHKESAQLLDSTPNGRQMLDQVMRDEQYIKRVYGDGASKVSPETLPKPLRDVYERYTNANKVVNDLNLQTGVIDSTTWKNGVQGQHIARRFDIPKAEKEVFRDHMRALFDQTAGIKRKDITQMEDDLIALLDKDPIRAIEFRTEMAARNLAFTEALDSFKGKNFIQSKAPNKGYIELKGKRFGKYQGQFMERVAYEQLTGSRQFLGDVSKSFNNLMETYQRSGLGKVDRLQKAFKTTLNVGTSVGNLMSNPMVFNVGAGTNPITQLFDMAGALKQMRKGMSDGDVYLARQLGVIGGDTGRILTGSANKTGSAVLKNKGTGATRRILDKAGRIYGGIDDVAKLGLFNRLRKQGLDPQKAALEVAKFTQDYNNVGRTVQLIADTPVMGKPFARFSPELVRIIKNNVTRAPHRVIAGVAGLAYITNKLSGDAGESPEERRTREEAVGQTLIPGTSWINKAMGGPDRDVSLNIPVGDSAVNIARTLGLNFPIEPGVDANQALIEQLLPVEIPTRKNAIGETVFDPTKVVTSMTLRPFVEQAFDQNFMGKNVSDPTNVTYDSEGNVKKFTEPSLKDQLINRGVALGASVLPMGYEALSIGSSLLGRPGPTGKERSVTDSIARSVGIKAEKNDPETRAKRTDTANFFEVTKPAQDNFLSKNKDLESLFFQVYPKTKDRNTGKKISDQIGPEKWARVNSEKSGRMFNFMKEQAIAANKRDSSQPIDPIYRLPKDQARELLELRARPTGDDIEREQILRATTDWFPELEKQERAYYKDLSKYFDKLKSEGVDIDSSTNDRVKKYNAIKYPEQPKFLKDYYGMKAKDPEGAKAYIKSFDKDWVNSQFENDAKSRLDYTNAKRAIEGFKPISWDVYDNVTYGYEDDESKVATELYFKGKEEGWGYGSGGKGRGKGKGGSTYLNPNQYAISLNAAGSRKVPVRIKKASSKAPVRAAKIAKPKVSMRKSKV